MTPPRPASSEASWSGVQAVRLKALEREERAARLQKEVEETKARAAEPGAVVSLKPKRRAP